ncbi:MAG: hypothetical protein U5R48_13690 [Gammaproteobacteria bacterium]|nr:hypothetical protein [Gammaproteobacteria bacterium]
MRKIAFAGAVAAFAVAPLAAVAGPGYTYVGAGYGVIEPDGADDLDGFTLEGSVAVHENVHLLAEFVEGEDGPIELDRTRIAAGYNMPLNSATDFVARGGWSFAEHRRRSVQRLGRRLLRPGRRPQHGHPGTGTERLPGL